MDIEEKTPSEILKDPLSLSLVDYLIGKVAALERRIELLEGKTTTPSENGDEQFKSISSELSALDKKLDKLIKQTANIPETKDEIEDIGDLPATQKTIETQAKSQTTAQKRIAVFIDGENISPKNADKIMKIATKRGQVQFARVYGLQNNSGKCWTKIADELNIKQILLAGGTKKNKVDKKIFEEITNETKKKSHVDTIVIATNDGDYAPVIKETLNRGVKVVVTGLKSAMSDKIRKGNTSIVYL